MVALIIICLLVTAATTLVLRRRRRRDRAGAWLRVSVIADSPGAMRDLAASAPRPDAEQRARSDRHFGYAASRRPRYRDEVDVPTLVELRPTQVVRVRDAAERVALEAAMPTELNVVFVEESAAERRVTVPLPRISDER